MLHLLIVALGGAIGAAARHLVNLAALRAIGPGVSWHTVAINILGSFLIGLLVAVVTRRGGGGAEAWRLFIATGVLGGFTTFSAFAFETAALWERGAGGQALLYVLFSVAGSLLAVFAGLALARALG